MTSQPSVNNEEDSQKGRVETAVRAFIGSSESSDELCREYLWAILHEYSEYSKRIVRWVIIGVSSIFIFELLNRQLVSEASIAIVKMARLSFLLYVLPIIVLGSFMQLMILVHDQWIYERVAKAIARQRFPGLDKSNLISLMTAQMFGSISDIPVNLISSRGIRLNNAVQFTQALMFIAAPVVFGIYAYVQLFLHRGLDNLVTWASLLISLTFSMLAIGIFATVVIDSESELE